MSYKLGSKNQMVLLPKSISEYVSQDDPVRVYDAFIEALDLEKLGLVIDENKVGNSAYNPVAMLKLLVYGYSYGWRSSRKLERAVNHNLSFIWLMSGLKPDHKTIAEFRKNNKTVLKAVLKQCARLCITLGLIEGNTLFLDGTKMRGNASINQTKTKKSLEKISKKVEENIDKLLEESKKIDNEEKDSMVKVTKELNSEKKRKAKIEKAMKSIEKKEEKAKKKQRNSKTKTKINLTDNECVDVKGRQGSHAGYNAQVVVDEKNGLIVNSDVVDENNDLNQFSEQIEKANEVLEKNCETACADAGYSNAKNLKKTIDKGITVVVPSQRQAAHKPKKEEPFNKDKFTYDEKSDTYSCPEGKTLQHKSDDKKRETSSYIIETKTDCINCKHYNVCTKSKNGRTITRLKEEKTKEEIGKFYETDEAQDIYKQRKEKAELPFGHIKRNLNGGYFLLRGKEGANAEMAINCTCFNIARMITLLGGVRPLIEKLMSMEK